MTSLEWRQDFPIFNKPIRGRPLVYLDNAATTLKPRPVLDAIQAHYESGSANIHRGVHYLSEEATRLYEEAREIVRAFIGAKETAEVIFTSGTTDAINMVARGYVEKLLSEGDEILITHMEHHANIVPWQMLCERTKARLVVAPIDDRGQLDLTAFEQLITDRTKFVSVIAVSNSLGTINPIKDIIAAAHRRDIPVMIDGAQMVAHCSTNVQDLGADFFVFSGHKLFAPTGIGVLYGRRALLERVDPVRGGGDMIRSVTFEKTTYAPLPNRLEAGTPHIAGVIGLGAAIEYINGIGLDNIAQWERHLLAYGTERLASIDGLQIVGTASNKAAILSFILEGVHPHDIGSILDGEGVAIRAGHHCTQPVMARFNIPATARASMSFYNTEADIDGLVGALQKAKEMFS